jgi:hypothetical protein
VTPRGRPLVRILEPEFDPDLELEEPPVAPPPSPPQSTVRRPDLRVISRTHQVIIGAFAAGVLGILLLINSAAGGAGGQQTAEAAPINTLPPSLLTTR